MRVASSGGRVVSESEAEPQKPRLADLPSALLEKQESKPRIWYEADIAFLRRPR